MAFQTRFALLFVVCFGLIACALACYSKDGTPTNDSANPKVNAELPNSLHEIMNMSPEALESQVKEMTAKMMNNGGCEIADSVLAGMNAAREGVLSDETLGDSKQVNEIYNTVANGIQSLKKEHCKCE